VFVESVFPLIDDVLNGYNATVFAYGQTGTGKTHTMEGNIHQEGAEGIIPRSVAALFAGVAEANESVEFTFKVSYVEIYMEKIRDLLDPNRLKNNLTVREDKTNGIYIAGVTEEYVTSFDELLQCMQSGAFNRATAATGMNEGSSRSHSVFTITVGQKDLQTATSKNGKLVLVSNILMYTRVPCLCEIWPCGFFIARPYHPPPAPLTHTHTNTHFPTHTLDIYLHTG
jgi:kinesin family protein 5